MRIIIAGSRGFNKREILFKKMDFLTNGTKVTKILCGNAKGADKLGEAWAKENKIPIEYHLPDWEKFGKAAGPIRNKVMAEKADALCLFWDGKSKVSANMFSEAKKSGLKIFTYHDYFK